MYLIPSSLHRTRGIVAATSALLTSALAVAQAASPVPPSSTPTPTLPTAPQAVEQRIEKIRIEDNSTVIDEVRVGGATKRIDVTPKGGMPAYQVAPESGERSWKVLGF